MPHFSRFARFATMQVAAIAIVIYGQTAIAHPLDNLQPGHWYEVPNSKLDSVAPDAFMVKAVMDAWSGAVYDTKRDRLVVWGGGHGDYDGNEIYAFDVDTMKWSRLTDPSTNTGGSEASGLYPDGLPRSRHTYNYIEYHPITDTMISLGAAAMYPGGSITSDLVSAFDFKTGTWNNNLARGGGAAGSASAYDPVTKLLWYRDAYNGGNLEAYDAIADKWYTYYDGLNLDIEFGLAVDSKRHVMLSINGWQGVNPMYIWDLDNPGNASTLNTTGDKTVEKKPGPGPEGFQYDPIADKFVAWSGGADVYTLTAPAGATSFSALSSKNWSWQKVPPASGNPVIPTSRNMNGTYGRFRYIPSRNAFILVNRTDENVYFYKLSSGGGNVDQLPPSAPTNVEAR